MHYFVALLIFILAYVVVDFLLKKVPSLVGIADVLAVVLGVFAAMFYLGVL